MVPCSGLLIRQFSFGQDLSEVTARAHFFVVRNQASKRSSILEEHKGRVLVMGAVNAIGEIACRVCDGDGGFFHENQIIRYYIENSKGFQAVLNRAPPPPRRTYLPNLSKVEKMQELNRFGFVPPRSRPVLLKLKGVLALFRNIMKPDPPQIHAAGAPVAFPTQRSHDSVVG